MKISFSLAIVLLALTATLVCDAGEPDPTGSADLPADAQRVVDRHLACLELIRDPREPDSDKDRIIRHELQRLRCDQSRGMLLKMKDKYRANSKIVEALQNAESGGAT